MKKLLLLLLSISSHLSVSIAQCPDAQFNASGPVCAGVAINFNNTSTGASSYSWDFCAGDFDTLITDTNEVSGFLNVPSGITSVIDSSGNYIFVCSRADDKIIRYDYGNGFDSPPTLSSDLGNMLGLVSSPNGIALYKENSIWYALVLSIFNGTLTKFDFTGGLDSLPSAGTVIVSSNLNFPRGIDLVTDNSGNIFAVVSNYTGSSLTVIDFGNSINNIPSVGTPFGLAGNGAIDVNIVKECDNWYAVVCCYTSNDVYLVDYGASLLNTPLSSQILFSGLSAPMGINAVNDNNAWFVVVTSSNNGKVSVQKIGSSLSSPTPVLIGDIDLGGGNASGLSMIKNESSWYGFVTMYSTNVVKKINFRNPCSASSATSTDPSPSGIIFNTGGSHFVQLEATDNSGNSDFFSLDVPVFISPISNFSVTGHCLGDQSIFIDSTTLTSGTITSWHWDFGNGDTTNVQSPAYTYSDTGAFTVTLTTVAGNGCSNDYSMPFEVSVVPVSDFSTQSGCSETELTFTDLSTISAGTISDWFWQFGNGDTSVLNNPVYSYATGGNYLVSLTITSSKGCSHSASQNLPVIDRPIGNFLAQNTCVGQTVQFIDQSSVSGTTITDYTWDFGDSNISSNQNPSHLYAGGVSIFPVRLIITAANGCIDTVDQNIKINNIPVASFSITPTVVCQNSDVQFTDLSIVSGDTISSWAWDFGDGLTDSVMNPVHQFATAGMKTISLIAYSPTKCPSAITQQAVNIIESPTALFSFTDVCLGATTQFTDLSTAPTGSVIVSRSWDFGGGDTSALTNPSHTYSTPGTFPVQFTVVTDAGCSNSIISDVPVHDLPTASFTRSNPCANQLTRFTNTSSSDSLSIISSYEWNFGDFGSGSANFSSLPDPTHTFSAANIYNVFLIATTNFSCKDTSQVAIRINPSAPAQFTYSPTCYGDLMEFFNPGSSIDSAYRWTFGDSQTNQLKEPAHFYAFPGNYTVTLTVYAIGGCATTATKQVSVSPIPTANFVSGPACINSPFAFVENSTIASGSIVGWEWSIANVGVIDSVQSPTYTFTDTGAYSVSLKVTSDIGCENSIIRTIISHQLPVANFSFNPQFGNPPLDVQFTDFSQGANQYVWDFGDGQSGSTIQQPSHIYQDTGLYIIQQKVISTFGCLDSITKNIYVIKPILDIAITGDSSYITGNYFHLVARIANLGTREIDSVSIEGRLADGTNVLEKYISLIPNGPAGIQWYRFHATFLISASTKLDYYCIKVIDPNGEADDVPANNEKCFSRIKELAVINPYPNPFTSNLIVRVILPFEDVLKLEIIDQLGKTMLSIPEKITVKGLTEFNLNLAEIPDGVYSVILQFRDERVIKQVIKNSLIK